MPTSSPSRRRAALAGGVGNVMEWYDWSVYATFAVYFSHQFFPEGDSVASMLQTFAVFALGFFARPIGSLTLGRLADRMSRRAALTMTVLIMAGTSVLIGVAPTATSIGAWAAVLLVLVRIVQGLALGAESGVVAGFLSESAGGRGRGSLTAVYAATAILGTLMGSLLGVVLTSALSKEQISDWGWRIPFLIGGALGVAAFVIRRGAEETFDPDENREPHPIRTIWREHRADVLRTVLTGSVLGLVFFTFIAGFPSGAVLLGADGRTAFLATSLALAVTVPLNIWFGGLSDRLGRRRVLIAGYITMVAATPIVIALMWAPDASWKVYGAQLVLVVPNAIMGGVTTAAMVERFPPHLRASGYAFVWAVSMAAFGGTGPIIATWLAARGLTFTMGAYVIALCAAAGYGVLTMREVAFSETPWEDAVSPKSAPQSRTGV